MFFFLEREIPLSTAEAHTLEEIWQISHEGMFRCAIKILANPHDAEDAVMDAVVRIAKNIAKFSPLDEDEIQALTAIYVRNTAIDLYNKRRQSPYPIEELPEAILLPAHDDSPETAAEIRETEEMLLSLIRQMPPSYRDVLELKCRFSMTNGEIAQTLHLTRGTVRTRLSRGRTWLRKNLDEAGGVR